MKIDLRVARDSNPSSVAGSIAKNIQEGKDVTLMAVGAAAVNQALKAATIARGYVASQGLDLVIVPGFKDVVIDGKTKTAMKLQIVTDR